MKGNTHLLRARQRQGLAQTALAVAAGVSPGLVCAVERYGHRPRPEVRARIARALGVEAASLWPGLKAPAAGTDGAGAA